MTRASRIAAALAAVVVASLAHLAQPAPALAQTEDDVVLLADQVGYDERLGLVTASGSVELARGGRVLRSDRLTYNKRSDLVTASGNVALLETDGTVVFADYVELTGDLKSGAIRGLGILLTDGSRLAASGGRMTADGRTALSKVVYSPCELCEDDPDRAPLWQLKAYRVVHDKRLHTIFYQDAFLELFGIPVLYTPFFSHPDPTVERKTGFLPPTFGRNSTLGITYTQPYFFNISPSRDATIAPTMTEREGPILTGEYREATDSGYYELAGSITRGSRLAEDTRPGDRTRGHGSAHGKFSINPYWRIGFDAERSTDATYLARYGFQRGLTTLVQDAYLQGRRGREHADIDLLYFQSLDPDVDEGTVPYVLPLFDYGWRSAPGIAGGVWLFDGNARVMGRSEGTDSRRLSVKGGWQLPHIGRMGDIYELELSLRGDMYHVNGQQAEAGTRPPEDGFTGRVVPQASLGWRWPWVGEYGSLRPIVEPIGQLVFSPNGGNSTDIPNEDSLSFEFDDANLFSPTRFPGLDRVESGFRANYGVRFALYGEGDAWSELFLGQAYRQRDDDTFEAGTGLSRRFSDYVGRLTVAPSDFVNLNLRFRLDRENLAARRASVSATAGPEWLRLSMSYVTLSDTPTTGVPSSVEQISAAASYRFLDNWRLFASHVHDLAVGGGSLVTAGGLAYGDECIDVSVRASRHFTRELDIEPDTTFTFTVRLRNLG